MSGTTSVFVQPPKDVKRGLHLDIMSQSLSYAQGPIGQVSQDQWDPEQWDSEPKKSIKKRFGQNLFFFNTQALAGFCQTAEISGTVQTN